jgi:hypothetical protein
MAACCIASSCTLQLHGLFCLTPKMLCCWVCYAAAALLLLVMCLALPASSQQIWPLYVTLTAERVDDMAVGNVTIINPTKQPVEVSSVPSTGTRAPCKQRPTGLLEAYPAGSCTLSTAEAMCMAKAARSVVLLGHAVLMFGLLGAWLVSCKQFKVGFIGALAVPAKLHVAQVCCSCVDATHTCMCMYMYCGVTNVPVLSSACGMCCNPGWEGGVQHRLL